MNLDTVLEMYKSYPTLSGYEAGEFQEWVLEILANTLGNKPADRITYWQLNGFFRQAELTFPMKFGKEMSGLDQDAIQVVLLTFFEWAAVELSIRRKIGDFDNLYDPSPPTEPLTLDQVEAILNTAQNLEPLFRHRNAAIMMLLLDSGIYYDELCCLQVQDIYPDKLEFKTRSPRPRRRGIFSRETALKWWRYLAARDEPGPREPAFVSCSGIGMTIEEAADVVQKIGAAAGIEPLDNVLLRRTCAYAWWLVTNSAANVTAIMGHTVLSEVLMNLAVTTTKVKEEHTRASPVKGLRKVGK